MRWDGIENQMFWNDINTPQPTYRYDAAGLWNGRVWQLNYVEGFPPPAPEPSPLVPTTHCRFESDIVEFFTTEDRSGPPIFDEVPVGTRGQARCYIVHTYNWLWNGLPPLPIDYPITDPLRPVNRTLVLDVWYPDIDAGEEFIFYVEAVDQALGNRLGNEPGFPCDQQLQGDWDYNPTNPDEIGSDSMFMRNATWDIMPT